LVPRIERTSSVSSTRAIVASIDDAAWFPLNRVLYCSACVEGRINGRVVVGISNNSGSGASLKARVQQCKREPGVQTLAAVATGESLLGQRPVV
jgi:hypothetical protein